MNQELEIEVVIAGARGFWGWNQKVPGNSSLVEAIWTERDRHACWLAMTVRHETRYSNFGFIGNLKHG